MDRSFDTIYYLNRSFAARWLFMNGELYLVSTTELEDMLFTDDFGYRDAVAYNIDSQVFCYVENIDLITMSDDNLVDFVEKNIL